MASFCQQTCKRCPCTGNTAASTPTTAPASPAADSSSPSSDCTCSDVPPSRYSCKDEAAWGKCGAGYMQPTNQLPEGAQGRVAGGRCH